MATTSKATWIWYPGDYEIWLGNKMNNRRTDRGAYFPPFWKQDSHYVTVEFSKAVELTEEETLTIATEGDYNIKIDGKMLFGIGRTYGRILTEERGENGFGYDSLFYSDDLKKSFAEASEDEKNTVSHRFRALKDLESKL